MSYFAGAFVEGVAGVAFVGDALPPLLSPPPLQPVTKAPITSPNSTIRVYNLFIVGETLTDSENLTSTKFSYFAACFVRFWGKSRKFMVFWLGKSPHSGKAPRTYPSSLHNGKRQIVLRVSRLQVGAPLEISGSNAWVGAWHVWRA
jgi:hypothetical protein